MRWSYELLSEPEQRVFRRMSVFAGGCSLAAAEAVCADDDLEPEDILPHLAHLVERSLVVADESRDAPLRYRLLETIRAFAAARLCQSREEDATRARHLTWCQALADVEVFRWSGEASRSRSEWLQLHAERDNLRAALRWSIDTARVHEALRLAGTLWPYWFTRGIFLEWRNWLEELLSLPGAEAQTIERARALAALSHAMFSHQAPSNEWPRMVALVEEAEAIARANHDVYALVQALDIFGLALMRAGRYEEAAAELEKGLGAVDEWQAPEGAVWKSALLGNLATTALRAGDRSTARIWAGRQLEEARRVGTRWGLARALLRHGVLAGLDGDVDTARSALAQALSASRDTDDAQTTVAILREHGILDLAAHQRLSARACFEEALLALRELQSAELVADVVAGVVVLCVDQSPAEAMQLAGAAARLRGRGEAAARLEESGRQLRLDEAIDLGVGLLASLGSTNERRRDARPAGLTAREWEVAGLLTDGLGNRQIAERLILGERTIDTYVDRIRDKLGVRSRVQIATWMREQRGAQM